MLDLRSGTHLFGKFFLVGDSKGADGADGVQYKLPNRFRADIVTAAGMGALLVCQRIGGAIVEVRGIGAALCAASGTVVGHLRSAVSAEQKSRQGIGFAKRIVASWCLAELLCKLPRFLIHDGFVGVLKNQPVLFGVHHRILILVGLLVRTEVDRMPHIFGLGKDAPDDITTPIIRVGKFLLAFPNTLVLFPEVNSGCFNLIIIEDTGNVIGAFALNGQTEYPADNLGGFLVDIPTVLITGHFLVAVDGAVGGRLARFALYTDSGALFAAQITKIPFVHDIEERRKLITVLVIAVHAVGNRNKVNAMLTEEHFRVKTGLQIISADSAHVLYDHMGDLTGFNICFQLLPCGTIEIAATPTVIGIVLDVRVASLLGIAFEVFFLIDNAVAIANLVIITGKSLVQCRNFIGILSHSLFHAHHDALLSDCRLICGASIIS